MTNNIGMPNGFNRVNSDTHQDPKKQEKPEKEAPAAKPAEARPTVDHETFYNFMDTKASLTIGILAKSNKPTESNSTIVNADTVLKQLQDIREMTNKTEDLFSKFDAGTQKAIAEIVANNINNAKELRDVVDPKNLEKLFEEITLATSAEECKILGKFGDVCEDIALYIGYLIGLIESGVKGADIDGPDVTDFVPEIETETQQLGLWGRIKDALRIGRELGHERGRIMQQ